jgi:hypothetical protein
MSNNKDKFKQGDRVYYEMGESKPFGFGKICGVIWPVIILELESPIEKYDFTHIYVLDVQIKESPKTATKPAEVVTETSSSLPTAGTLQ